MQQAIQTSDADYVLCECPIDRLRELVEGLEQRLRIEIVRQPSVCLTMLRTEDSLDQQEFFLGETLASECEVTVNGKPGYGLCMGDQPQRSYCLAVLDALLNEASAPHKSEIDEFLKIEGLVLAEAERREFNLTLRSQVNFRLMEQE